MREGGRERKRETETETEEDETESEGVRPVSGLQVSAQRSSLFGVQSGRGCTPGYSPVVTEQGMSPCLHTAQGPILQLCCLFHGDPQPYLGGGRRERRNPCHFHAWMQMSG